MVYKNFHHNFLRFRSLLAAHYKSVPKCDEQRLDVQNLDCFAGTLQKSQKEKPLYPKIEALCFGLLELGFIHLRILCIYSQGVAGDDMFGKPAGRTSICAAGCERMM